MSTDLTPMNQERWLALTAIAADPKRLADKIGIPVTHWVNKCHQVSLALVKTGEFGPTARVARGWSLGIHSQHSWIVLGDPYAWDAVIIDATNPEFHRSGEIIHVSMFENGGRYMPQGWGVLAEEEREGLQHIMPTFQGPERPLTPKTPLSADAQLFLAEIGPMDFRRWCWLASMLPMQGWPAKEIIEAMDDSGMRAAIPVDILGMVTDRNPRGLYLPTREETDQA